MKPFKYGQHDEKSVRLQMRKKKWILNRILFGISLGIFSGIVICIYRYLISLCDKILNEYIFPVIHGDNLFVLAAWGIILVFLAWLVYRILKVEPDAAGGGIPHATDEIQGLSDSKWWSVLLAKITTAPLCILAGFSLGKTGPSIELGCMSGKGIQRASARLFPDRNFLLSREELCCSGAGAGLSALFNAPVSGMLFVREKLHTKLDISVITIAIASLTAYFVSVSVFGLAPVVDISIPVTRWEYYPAFAILGILLGILGKFYSESLCFFTRHMAQNKKASRQVMWILLFLFAGLIGYFFPDITGGGSLMLSRVMDNQTVFSTLLFLLLGKYLFSMISSGSGLPGGTVYPLLVTGACIGKIYGTVLCWLFPSMAFFPTFFILGGMSGFFAAILGAPITGIFLMFEFSLCYTNLIPLTVTCLFSYLTMRSISRQPDGNHLYKP